MTDLRTYPVAITAAMVTGLQRLALPSGCRLRLLVPELLRPGVFDQWCADVRQTLRQEGTLTDLFWWQQHTPDEAKGSLNDMQALCRNGIVLALVYAPPEAKDLYARAGIALLSDIIPGEQAQATMWYAKHVLPHTLRLQVTAQVLTWVFTHLGLKRLWAQTISPRARAHFVTCGAEVWASIPQYAYYKGEQHAIDILRITAAQVRHEGESHGG